MAKGSYKIAVSDDSNADKDGKKNNGNQECCLSPAFLRSLSLHDQPRSTRDPSNKELCKSRYRELVSLEKIPSKPSFLLEAISDGSKKQGFESVGIVAETGVNVEPSIHNASSSASQHENGQNQLSELDGWLGDRHARLSVESEKLLEKAVGILKTVDMDISESLANLKKPESIALESVVEIYRNKSRSAISRSSGPESDASKEPNSEPIYENWQPSVQDILSTESSSESIYENWQPSVRKILSSESFSEPIYENCLIQKRLNDVQDHINLQSPNNMQADSTQQSLKNTPAQSNRQSPKNTPSRSTQRSPKNMQDHSPKQSLKNRLVQSSQERLKNVKTHSTQQSSQNSVRLSPKNSHSPSSQTPNMLADCSLGTLRKSESLLSSNSSNTQSMAKQNSDSQAVELSHENLSSCPKINAKDDTTKEKSLVEFNLPSDHEQFIKIIGALQIRCLEYREMIQDIAVSAVEECLNFSKRSINRILRLRKQFESQKRNFRDFKKLCSKSVVFGPDSLPINERVTEVIQSFYLKLLQEENETLMTRLEFGLRMGEEYDKMLKLEMESKKIIKTLEKEIIYLKKTSVGFKV